MVCGPVASGKSWVCNQLEDVFYVMYDGLRGFSARFGKILEGTKQPLPIVYDPSRNVVSFMRKNAELRMRIFCILEEPEVIEARLLARGGAYKEGYIKLRVKRFKSIAKRYGEFCGTAEEVLARLSKVLHDEPQA